ncbi:MAG: type IV secretory system conjugative DNA transfer family protein [Spiroplasma ixodetis]|nr:type IV secretory system conjugative DNA transfer family protein [Spiroplasma ixodetis]MBP1528746.1 type IV secretory system conjugative DNA transfer family protein [Spiroplasma ixodetis]
MFKRFQTGSKGELFEKQSLILEKQGYNIKVLDLKNFEIGNQWNPLNYIFKLWKQKSYIKVNKEIDSLVNIICPIHYNTNPHWDQTAQNFIKGIIYALLEDYDMNKNINENNFNFSSINKILFLPLTELKTYIFDRDIESKARKYFANLNTTSQENKEVDSLMSTTKTVLNKFENLEIILSNNNFDFQEFIDKPTALFLILSDHSNEYHFLANLFIAQLYKFLVGKADNSNLKTLKRPILFLLDEFANLPTIKDIDNWITAARSRSIWFMLVIQDFEQLKNKYKNYRTLIANCNLKYFLHTNDYQNAKILAEEYGTIKVNETSMTKSEKHTSTTTYQKQVPLITAETLIKLPMNTQIIKYNRLNVAKVETLPIWKIKNYSEGKTSIINKIKDINIETVNIINNKIKTIKDKINWLLKQDLNQEIKNIIKQIKNEKDLQNYMLKIKENLSLELVLKIKENNII